MDSEETEAEIYDGWARPLSRGSAFSGAAWHQEFQSLQVLLWKVAKAENPSSALPTPRAVYRPVAKAPQGLLESQNPSKQNALVFMGPELSLNDGKSARRSNVGAVAPSLPPQASGRQASRGSPSSVHPTGRCSPYNRAIGNQKRTEMATFMRGQREADHLCWGGECGGGGGGM